MQIGNKDWIKNIKINPDKSIKIIYDQFREQSISWIMSNYKLNIDESDEIFQSSIIILYDNVMTGKLTNLESSLKTYIFSIIKNKIIQYNRYQNKVQKLNSYDILDDYITAEYEDIETQRLEATEKALILLGDPCKTILELFYYQQKKIEELTVIMGYKNTDTTKNIKYKCLKRLQKLILE